MTEYWKSIPKKYCEVCKVWYQDNKISVEHHERGFSHQANIRKRLKEVRQEGHERAKEQNAYELEMRKIEAAALKSFQSDLAADPRRAHEIASLKPIPGSSSSSITSQLPTSKFGESTDAAESSTLLRGREKALETIASKMQKKSKWLEAKTAEGNIYYWNRETFDTVWEPPKSGYLSLEEQNSGDPALSTPPVPPASSRPGPYGRWQEVEDTPYSKDMVDLQLPVNESTEPQVNEEDYILVEPDEHKQDDLFTEKTVESKTPKVKVEFKKRHVNSQAKRNVRRREESP